MGAFMGFQVSGPRDLASRFVNNANMIAVNDATTPIELNGPFLIMANPGTPTPVGATLTLEMSVDGGTTWVVPQDRAGNNLLANVAPPINRIIEFPSHEDGLLFRLRLTAITSGQVIGRLSSGGRA
jgi:hypothetical protein